MNQPAPTIVSAVPQLNSIQLNWIPSLGIVLYYTIQYSNNGGSSWTTLPQVPPSVYSYTVTNLSSGSSYLLRISAKYRTYTTPFSTPIGPVNPLSLTPSGPTNFVVKSNNQSLDLTWNKPINIGNSPIISYYVEYSSNSGASWTLDAIIPSPTLNYSIKLLNNGTTYLVRIRASNSAGFGTYTTSSPVLVFGPPSPPRNLTSSIPTSGNSVNLRFLEPANHGGKLITQYRIRYAGFKTLKEAQDYNIFVNQATVVTLSNPYNTINPNAIINTTISNLTNGLFYTFTIRAVNSLPLSDLTASKFSNKVIVRPRGLPQAPTNLDIDKIADKSVSISWLPPINTGGVPILDYIVQYHNGSNWETFDDGYNINTSTTVINLNNGTPYTFRVAAVNNVGTGPFSQVSVTAIPGSKPLNAPTSVSGVSLNKSVLLSWTAPANNGGSPITHYNIQYSSNNGVSWTSFSNITSTNLGTLVTGLVNGTSYIFRVSASNTIGAGPWSASSAPVVPAAQIPLAPRDLVAKSLDASAMLSWLAPSDDNGSPITNYTIQRSLNGGVNWTTIATVGGSQTTHLVKPLVNGQSYIFRIAAINSIGTGPYSNNSNVVIPKPIPAQNILLDKDSINDSIDTAYNNGFIASVEPWKSYFMAAADRLSRYLKYKTSVISAIRNQPGYSNWNGAIVTDIQFVYDDSAGYLAYAAPNRVIDFTINSIPGINLSKSYSGYNTISYFVGINTYYINELTDSNWIDNITHEILHGLGFGLFWNEPFQPSGGKKLPQNNQGFLYGTNDNYPLTSFIYEDTVNRQWSGGQTSPFHADHVPLAVDIGEGSDYYHWSPVARYYSRQEMYPGLKNDMMGPFGPLPGQKDVLSLLTIKSLVEFGYDEVMPGDSEGLPIINTSHKASSMATQSDGSPSQILCGCHHLKPHISPDNIIKVTIN